MKYRVACLVAVTLFTATGCVTNPVTGERNLGLVSGEQEVQLGEQNFQPTQQITGGPFDRDPELTRYVQRVGQKVAAQSERQLPYEFVVINSGVPNAWALPGGKIGINHGLLAELDNEAELAAVLGHEVVHSAARHTAQQMERGMLMQLGVAAAGIAASESGYGDLAVGAGMLGAQVLSAKYGRDAELEADRHGMRYLAAAGYEPEAAVSLQETFVRLSEDRRQSWLEGLFASHPPSQARVEKNREYAQELAVDGELGRQAFQQHTAYVRRVQPAYAKYQEGVQALQQKQPAVARQKAHEALEIEPQEGKFHGLLGQAAMAEDRRSEASAHFDAAIQRNPEYFEYYLYRGMLREDAGQLQQARQDFERSNQLLPTAIAHEKLGDIASRQGRRGDAVQHYQVAAQSDSAVGQRALAKFRQLGGQ